MINCVAPLVLGCFTFMITGSPVVQGNIGSQKSPSAHRLDRIPVLALNSAIMGLVNFFGCYYLPAFISMVRLALSESAGVR
jgi:hypothetical protein